MEYPAASLKFNFQFYCACAGCGGEAVRRIAAFPPHPLRTRFLSKKLKGGLSHPHSNKASCLEQGGDSMDISAKLRPFYVAKMLYEQTDEDHYLTIA